MGDPATDRLVETAVELIRAGRVELEPDEHGSHLATGDVVVPLAAFAALARAVKQAKERRRDDVRV